MPRPRKDSDVSLMIIAGIARVLVAMMCERNVGTMCRMMMRPRLAPGAVGAREIGPRGAAGARGAERVNPGRDDAERAGRIAGDEDSPGDPPALVHAPLHAQGRGVALARHVGDPRARPKAV